jgi:hypothetical protein
MWVFWMLVLILLPLGAIAGMIEWDMVLIGWAILVGSGLVASELARLRKPRGISFTGRGSSNGK